jgi:hypothetical protein
MRNNHLLAGFCLLISATSAMGQVPNGNFETWADHGTYQDPAFWNTTNAVAVNLGAMPTCTRVEPGWEGSACMKVVNQTALNGVVMQGNAVSVGPNGNGFAVVGRPASLEGKCLYGLDVYDVGKIRVSLTKWDSLAGQSVLVGSGMISFTGTDLDWHNFTVPIGYAGNLDPDTAMISISAAGGVVLVTAGSFLQVDDLKFVYTADGIRESVDSPDMTVFPTIAHEQLQVTAQHAMREVVVLDVLGRPVLRQVLAGLEGRVPLSGLANGRYVVQVRFTDGGLGRRSFLKY